jgi:hypothetical protein
MHAISRISSHRNPYDLMDFVYYCVMAQIVS